MKRIRKRKRKKSLLANIVVISTGLFTIFLLLFVISLSLFSIGELNATYGSVLNSGAISEFSYIRLLPQEISLEQYKNTIWMNSDFWFSFWNSVGICLPIILGICVIGTLGGYAFARFSFPGRNICLFITILVMMIPSQVMIPSQFRTLYEMELINHSIAVILPNIFAPLGVYLIYQYVRKLPEDIFEAARMDGANEFKIFAFIALPNLRGGIVSLSILTLVDVWSMIEQPMAFLQEEYKRPLAASLKWVSETGGMSLFVSCVMFTIPMFLVFLLGKEELVEGIGQSIVSNDKER